MKLVELLLIVKRNDAEEMRKYSYSNSFWKTLYNKEKYKHLVSKEDYNKILIYEIALNNIRANDYFEEQSKLNRANPIFEAFKINNITIPNNFEVYSRS